MVSRDSRKLADLSGTALILFAFAVLVCARMPEILIKGRFWAEEGSVFFLHAWNEPPLQALLLSYGGYLNLGANAGAVAARWIIPLAYAPYLTIAIGLLFQLAPPLLLLTARDEWLRPLHVRLAGVVLILAVPGSEEIWLQTLHCQFQLMLSAGLIVGLATTGGWVGALRLLLLFLAPLCGPGVIILVPLFLLRAAVERSPARALQVLVLAAGAAVQLAFFYVRVTDREYALHPILMLTIVATRNFAVPFLGPHFGQSIGDSLRSSLLAGHAPWVSVSLPIIVFGALGAVALRQGLRQPSIWLLAASALTAVICYFGVLGGAINMVSADWGQRYVYVPQALLSLSLLAIAATRSPHPVPAGRATRPPRSVIADPIVAVLWTAIGWLIVVGALRYFLTWDVIGDGPAWRAEVSAWEADPSHSLQLWPTGWSVQLNRNDSAPR
jgi:hypothetical protein